MAFWYSGYWCRGGEAIETRQAANLGWLIIVQCWRVCICGDPVRGAKSEIDAGATHARNQLLSAAMRGSMSIAHHLRGCDLDNRRVCSGAQVGVSVVCSSVAIDKIGRELLCIGLNPSPLCRPDNEERISA